MVFDDMIADIEANYKLIPIIHQRSIRIKVSIVYQRKRKSRN